MAQTWPGHVEKTVAHHCACLQAPAADMATEPDEQPSGEHAQKQAAQERHELYELAADAASEHAERPDQCTPAGQAAIRVVTRFPI